jgi:tetratricopeptide (TPR) repeat protein
MLLIMKNKICLCSLLFILGIVLGSIVTYSVQLKKFQHSANLYQSIQQENRYKDFERCNRAYFQKSPEIAVWGLENYIDDTMSLLKTGGESGSDLVNNMNLFIAHARLAKLYQKLGNQEKSEEHFRSAIVNFNEAGRDISGGKYSASISNNVEVLNEIQKYDAKAKGSGRE